MTARRKADILIASGQVKINGATARTGQQVDPARDRVTVNGKVVRPPARETYVMLNKPRGVLSTVRDDRGRPTVLDGLGTRTGRPRLFPVGRLDLNSRGLVLLTDDGELAVRLLHPRYHVEKEYRVRIAGTPSAEAIQRLREGMTIGEELFAPVSVRIIRSDSRASDLSLVLWEGRKREVRRLWAALGHRVDDLQRVRIGPLRLGSLRSGEERPLTSTEVLKLHSAVGLQIT